MQYAAPRRNAFVYSLDRRLQLTQEVTVAVEGERPARAAMTGALALSLALVISTLIIAFTIVKVSETNRCKAQLVQRAYDAETGKPNGEKLVIPPDCGEASGAEV